MKWFKHDSNAHTDTKLKKVRHKYGITGYGLYWYCVELIAGKVSKENITFELEDDAEIIAIDWNLDQLKVQEIMRYFINIGLFESQNNTITCLKLAKRLDDTNAKNPEIKLIINKLDKFRNNPKLSEESGDSPKLSDEVGDNPSNSDQNRIEENRIDNKKINKKNKITFFDYIEICKKNNITPIPRNSIVFENSEKIGISHELINLTWIKFKDFQLNDNKNKKYADWVSAFNNYVKNNYFQLWWIDENGEVKITTKGQQAKKLYAEELLHE